MNFDETNYDNIFTAVVVGVAATNFQDLLSILVPAAKSIDIMEVIVSQQSEEGAAQDEMLGLTLRTFTGHTAGSGGGTVTPENEIAGGQASGCTVRRSDTTQATGGTSHIHHSEAFNVMDKFAWPLHRGRRIHVPAGYLFVVSLDEAPADSISFRVTVRYGEND